MMGPELAKGMGIARQLLNHFTPVRLGIPVLQGFLLGGVLLFLKSVFEPLLTRSLSGLVDLNAASDALWFVVGIAIVFCLHSLLGRPLVSDSKREQIDILELIIERGDLSRQERKQIFRTVAWNYAQEINLTQEITQKKLGSMMDEAIKNAKEIGS